ncbi:MAG: hypothetical protein NC908_03425 [Candidatus Omnitrophica bacterium]|nr:hypothetical protein [Candidatus Omnitrophota bacterium]
MDVKAKIIIIVLFAVSAASSYLNLQLYNSRAIIQKERDALESENKILNQSIDEAKQENLKLQNRITTVSAEVDRLSKENRNLHSEKQNIQRKYEQLDNERKGLIQKIDSLQEQIKNISSQSQVAPVASPQTDDSYWAGVLKEKAKLEVELQNISQQIRSVQLNNDQLQKEKNALQQQIEDLNKQRQILQKQLESNLKIIDNLADELVKEKKYKRDIQKDIESAKNENTLLKQQLRELNDRKNELEEKLAQLSKDSELLKAKLTEKEQVRTEAQTLSISEETKIKTTGSSVELPPIVVRPSQAGSQPLASRIVSRTGKILAVDKENNFVIIDLGKDAGLKLGDTFQVYRDNQSIGLIEVIQIRSNVSACDIKKQTTPIRIGDLVR